MKTIYTCFSTDVIHDGHKNIIKQALNYGRVIVGCLSDKEMIRCTKFPTKTVEERMALYRSMHGVEDVVIQNDMLYNDVIEKLHPDYVVHGDNWKSGAEREEAAAFFLVAGGKWWEQKKGTEVMDWLEETDRIPPVSVIYNHAVRGAVRKSAERFHCFRAPEFPDPFCQTQQTDSFYSMLTETMLPLSKTEKAGTLWESIRAIFGKKEK